MELRGSRGGQRNWIEADVDVHSHDIALSLHTRRGSFGWDIFCQSVSVVSCKAPLALQMLSFSQSSLLRARIIRPSTSTPVRHLRTAITLSKAADTEAGTQKPKQKQQQKKGGGGKQDENKLTSQEEDFSKYATFSLWNV
eukprot:7408212-Pyramimonas_sp.AAC.2